MVKTIKEDRCTNTVKRKLAPEYACAHPFTQRLQKPLKTEGAVAPQRLLVPKNPVYFCDDAGYNGQANTFDA